MTANERLPPPGGLKWKLRRARKQLRQLRRSFVKFAASNPVRWTAEVNAEGTHYVYRMFVPEGPYTLQFLADEAVHHMRSLLDHLITAMVESEGRNADYTKFPILDERPNSKARSQFEKDIRGLEGYARKVIIDAQPYQRGDAAKRHPLSILATLDNRFKHATLEMLAYRIAYPNVPGIIQRGRVGNQLAESGAVFAEVPVDVDVEKDFEPRIDVYITFHFMRVGVDWIGLDTLDEIYNFIRDELMAKLLSGRGMPPRLADNTNDGDTEASH